MGAVRSVHDRDGSIRNSGGNVPIVIQRRFSDVIVRDTDIAPTIEAGGGEGGNNLPMILVRTEGYDISNRNRNAEPRSASGQL